MTTQVVPFLFETQTPVRVIMIDGNPWFFAQDVAQVLGYSATGAMNKLIDEEDRCFQTFQNGTTYIKQSLINESGLYQAIFSSTLPDAKKFKKWVTSEVLPTIRKTGSYSLSGMASLSSHTVRANQLANSKAVNRHHIELGGRQAVIAYNQKNCILQSGKTPAEWKLIGKQEGMTSRQRESAKNVLRIKAPQVACGMSLADELVNGSVAQDDAISVGKDAQPIFQRILALGFTPPELLI
ncbi:MAG: hypothetical protein KC415_19235 [Anaerolineales bacterium]|nr:hypothetical protein [Anaerolineales bacterium]